MFKSLLCNSITPKLQRTLSSSITEQGRHRYPEEVERSVNKQIMNELTAGYTYLSMAAYFGKPVIGLPGCHGFFMKMYLEEQEHAFRLIDYQNQRSGNVELCSITVIGDDQDWKSVCNAFRVSLKMEKDVKEVNAIFY